MYRGAPIVTLLSRDDAQGFVTHVVSVDPIERRWKPGSQSVGLRVVSELVDDQNGRTWMVAPWDGIIKRLP